MSEMAWSEPMQTSGMWGRGLLLRPFPPVS